MKGSPFKLRSPLKLGNLSDKSLEIQSASLEGQESKANAAIELNNVSTGAPDKVIQESPNETAKRNASVVNKGEGTTAFDRDGRSVDKFDQRIAHAESKGKLGRAQRLKNRKSGFMESQANKFERAGGTLSDQQKKDLNKAGDEAKGTRVGRALRVLGNREAKQRPVSTKPVSLNSANNKGSESSTTGNSSLKISLGDNFFGNVTKNIKQPTDYDKYVAGKTPQEKKDGIDTAEMFYNKNQ
tara:strand:- start:33 stop:755 length:723 start_codon:yes stop_codon:yes gene_type:complete